MPPQRNVDHKAENVPTDVAFSVVSLLSHRHRVGEGRETNTHIQHEARRKSSFDFGTFSFQDRAFSPLKKMRMEFICACVCVCVCV